jgi:hypothetical protein
MAFGDVDRFRCLEPDRIIFWVNEWDDNGLLSWAILQSLLFVVVFLIPFVYLHLLTLRFLTNKQFREALQPMPAFTFLVGIFIAIVIANDFFFTCLFASPIWAAVYIYAGVDTAVDIEMFISNFRATGILSGVWSN